MTEAEYLTARQRGYIILCRAFYGWPLSVAGAPGLAMHKRIVAKLNELERKMRIVKQETNVIDPEDFDVEDASRMIFFGREVRRRTLEEAAKACDNLATPYNNLACRDCAAEIRALAEHDPDWLPEVDDDL